jgi:DNA replication protein DnaC
MMVSGDHNRSCEKHAALRPPKADPWPMSTAERRASEEGYWHRLATRYDIPPRYRSLRLDELAATPAVQAVREFLEDEDNCVRCLTLAGPPGVGKTVALVAAFREEACWGAAPDSAIWYSMSGLVRALLANAGTNAGTVVEAAINADLLALDDLGLAYLKAGGLAESAIEEILVEREAREAMTLMTTNLPLPAFEAHVGDRVADRLRGPWGVWYSLPGQSLRRKRRGTGA